MTVEPLFSMKNLVFMCGALQFCQLVGMRFAPAMFHWKEDLAKLTEINRRIFRVMTGGMLILVLGTGVLVMLAPGEIVGGGRLGTAFSGFLFLVWLYRGSAQVFLYGHLLPPGWVTRFAHYGMVSLFAFQASVYLIVFLRGIL